MTVTSQHGVPHPAHAHAPQMPAPNHPNNHAYVTRSAHEKSVDGVTLLLPQDQVDERDNFYPR